MSVVIPDDDFKSFDPDTVVSLIDTVLNSAEFLAKLTPTPVDDKVVATLKTVVAATWFKPLLTYVLGLVAQGKLEELAALVEAFTKHKS